MLLINVEFYEQTYLRVILYYKLTNDNDIKN